VPTGETGGRIARVYLGDDARDPAEPQEYPVAAEALAAKVGLYRNALTGVSLHVDLHQGRLRLDGDTELVPIAPDRFQAGGGGARFVFEPGAGRPGIRTFSSEGNEEAFFEPVEPFRPSAKELSAYAGRYYSADAETELVVSVAEGELVLRRRPDWTARPAPEYRDAFDVPEFGLIRFHRSADGRVVELGLTQPRVYDMRFRRVGESEERTSSR
jgi:hypothetical protein